MAMKPNRSGGVNSGRPRTIVGRVDEEFTPMSEWKQEQDSDILLVYLPGFLLEYINVTIENRNILRIRGKRPIAGNKGSHFQKDFQVPENCDMSVIRAKFDGGILTVTMPRKITIPKGDTTITRVPKQEATAEIKPIRPPRSTTEQAGGTSAIPSTSTPGMMPSKPSPSGEVEGDAPLLEKEYRPLNTNHKSKKTTEEAVGTSVIPSTGTTEIKPIRPPSGKLEEDAPFLEKQETPPSTDHPSKGSTKEAVGSSVIFSTGISRIKPIMTPSGKLEDNVPSLEKQGKPPSINHPLKRTAEETGGTSASSPHKGLIAENIVEKIVHKKGLGDIDEKSIESPNITHSYGYGSSKVDEYKNVVKGLAKGINVNEERELLVNMGVAVLVIVALGVYVSNTFGSSAKSS